MYNVIRQTLIAVTTFFSVTATAMDVGSNHHLFSEPPIIEEEVSLVNMVIKTAHALWVDIYDGETEIVTNTEPTVSRWNKDELIHKLRVQYEKNRHRFEKRAESTLYTTNRMDIILVGNTQDPFSHIALTLQQ